MHMRQKNVSFIGINGSLMIYYVGTTAVSCIKPRIMMAISLATCTISSRLGVIKPERPIMSADDPDLLEQIVTGVSHGCRMADCALLGGETAIMPDLYAPGDYDLAGFCVGVAEKSQLIDGRSITPGDRILGVASSGLHSNGFSLVRKVVFDKAGHKRQFKRKFVKWSNFN